MRDEGIGHPEGGLLTGDRIAAVLREDIFAGRLLPGSRLKDAELAARFNVSRNTARDAVRHLGADGLVTARLNAGSAVRRLSEDDARDIYSIRRVLETSGIEASSRVPREALDGVTRALDEAGRAVEKERWGDLSTASLQFHRALVALNGSARLNDFFGVILAQLRLVFAVMPDESAFQLRWIERDQDIAAMVASGRRREATAALMSYLSESESLIIDAIRAAESEFPPAAMPSTPH